MRAIGVVCVFVCGCNQVFGIDTTKLEFPDATLAPDAVGCSGATFSGLSQFPISLSPLDDPALTGDGSQLWFDHTDSVTGHTQVFFATGSPGGPYSGDNPAPFIDASGVANSSDPALTEDGLRLVFIRNSSVWEVSRASITDAFPATPSPLNSLGNAQSATLSRDGLVAYFDNAGELFTATRTKLMDSFSPVVDLQVAGHNPTVSPDQLELFYDTTGFPGANIERRVRPSVGDPFGPAEPIQSGAYEPSITFDSRTLLMVQTSTPVLMQMTRTCP